MTHGATGRRPRPPATTELAEAITTRALDAIAETLAGAQPADEWHRLAAGITLLVIEGYINGEIDFGGAELAICRCVRACIPSSAGVGRDLARRLLWEFKTKRRRRGGGFPSWVKPLAQNAMQAFADLHPTQPDVLSVRNPAPEFFTAVAEQLVAIGLCEAAATPSLKTLYVWYLADERTTVRRRRGRGRPRTRG